MGTLRILFDSVLFVYFVFFAVVAPLIDAQTCIPHRFYPQSILDIKTWYVNEFDDQLVSKSPNFFVGLIWLELVLQWPLSLLNLYAIITSKSWFRTSCLIHGVSVLTSMVAIGGELVGSGKVHEKVTMVYYPFFVFSLLAILRGLLNFNTPKTSSSSSRRFPPHKKKRV